eukprot:CAMPEP_0170343132 /NCGR_PEP_ID=MMETSP0116_2-20130129/72735_1 /TAXON_ID=400756 /ORGANISM="Durinskia baltica, Strain CSIRO CS-38" /LENGTH=87 /DNA_ID=CAMNT_0010596773 /DNA_START=195 /DNA_END=454 /DNA_ORIENTATION=+
MSGCDAGAGRREDRRRPPRRRASPLRAASLTLDCHSQRTTGQDGYNKCRAPSRPAADGQNHAHLCHCPLDQLESSPLFERRPKRRKR